MEVSRHATSATHGLAGKQHIFLSGKYADPGRELPGRWKGRNANLAKPPDAFVPLKYAPSEYIDDATKTFSAAENKRKLGFRSSGRLCREHCRTQLQVSRYREALRREHLTAEKGRKAATAKALAFAAEDTRARPSSTLSGRERRELIREARQAHRPRSAVVNGRTLSDFDRTIGDAKFTYDPAAHLKRSGSQVATKAIRRGSMSTTASSYGDGVWHSTHEQPKHGKSAFGPTASAHVSLGFGQ